MNKLKEILAKHGVIIIQSDGAINEMSDGVYDDLAALIRQSNSGSPARCDQAGMEGVAPPSGERASSLPRPVSHDSDDYNWAKAKHSTGCDFPPGGCMPDCPVNRPSWWKAPSSDDSAEVRARRFLAEMERDESSIMNVETIVRDLLRELAEWKDEAHKAHKAFEETQKYIEGPINGG